MGIDFFKAAHYSFFIVWTAWTAHTLYATPWMIETHAPRTHLGKTKLVISKGDPAVVAKDVLFPSWYSVRRFDVLLLLDIDSLPGADAWTSLRLRESPLAARVKCVEFTSGTSLVFYDWGLVKHTSHRYAAADIPTAVPRFGRRGQETRPPKCTLALRQPPDSRWRSENVTVRWEIHVTPQWSRYDWIPRDLDFLVHYAGVGISWLFQISQPVAA